MYVMYVCDVDKVDVDYISWCRWCWSSCVDDVCSVDEVDIDYVEYVEEVCGVDVDDVDDAKDIEEMYKMRCCRRCKWSWCRSSSWLRIIFRVLKRWFSARSKARALPSKSSSAIQPGCSSRSSPTPKRAGRSASQSHRSNSLAYPLQMGSLLVLVPGLAEFRRILMRTLTMSLSSDFGNENSVEPFIRILI